jgi:hypothetical protein
VLLTVDLVRYLDDLRRGRLHPNPLSAPGDAPPADLAGLLAGAVAGDSVPGLVAALEPQLVQYRNLRALLVRYRTLAADSTLVPLPAGPPVHPGEPYAALAELRHTLIALGDLAPDSAAEPGDVYEEVTAAAVRRFQQRHALESDGILGRKTREALNTPLARRVEQIELALERLRWVPPIRHQRFLVVNIPAFQLLAFEPEAAGPVAHHAGRRGARLDKRTPVLLEDLRYVEFRPYWNVPRSILVERSFPVCGEIPATCARTRWRSSARMTRSWVTSDLRGARPAPARRAACGNGGAANARPGQVRLSQRRRRIHARTPQTQLFARRARLQPRLHPFGRPDRSRLWVLDDRPEWSRERIDSAIAGPARRGFCWSGRCRFWCSTRPRWLGRRQRFLLFGRVRARSEAEARARGPAVWGWFAVTGCGERGGGLGQIGLGVT